MIIKYLITRDGREYILDAVPDWAKDDPEYKVTALAPVGTADMYDKFIVEGSKEDAPSLPSTDDTQERIQLMEELFQLQETDITLLKAQLEKFVEAVEGIVELTDVVSQSNIENRSKLIIIGDSCKALLKPRE